MAEVLALNIVLILVLLLVVGPIVARAVDMARQANGPGGPGGPGIGGAVPRPGKPASIVPAKAVAAALPAPASPTAAPPAETPRRAALDDIPRAIDVDRIEGNVKASSVKRVGAIIDMRPREAAGVISAWLSENGA